LGLAIISAFDPGISSPFFTHKSNISPIDLAWEAESDTGYYIDFL